VVIQVFNFDPYPIVVSTEAVASVSWTQKALGGAMPKLGFSSCTESEFPMMKRMQTRGNVTGKK